MPTLIRKMVPTVAACIGHWHIWDTEKRVADYWGEIGWDQERPLKGANYEVPFQKIILFLTSGSISDSSSGGHRGWKSSSFHHFNLNISFSMFHSHSMVHSHFIILNRAHQKCSGNLRRNIHIFIHQGSIISHIWTLYLWKRKYYTHMVWQSHARIHILCMRGKA